jgi:hypothetical protein
MADESREMRSRNRSVMVNGRGRDPLCRRTEIQCGSETFNADQARASLESACIGAVHSRSCGVVVCKGTEKLLILSLE